MTENPYHEGELRVQERLGVAETARRLGRAIADEIPAGAVPFIGRQRMMIVGSIDREGWPWASMLLGEPGFVKAPDPATLEVDLERATHHPDDPLWTDLGTAARVGTLLIDLATRRRFRVNGRVDGVPERRLGIAVDEAYGNCPKYIQRRHATADSPDLSTPPAPARRGERLEEHQRRLIEAADTLFVASAHPDRGVDASHRGGNPGFVTVTGDRTLRVPDYAGNSMYNTLGNFAVNSVAGLLLIDFDRRVTLQLTGRAEILWHLDRPAGETGGTQRYWELAVERWIETDLAPGLGWELLDRSPFNPEVDAP